MQFMSRFVMTLCKKIIYNAGLKGGLYGLLFTSIGYTPRCQENTSGFGVVVTCNFPKVEITGSNPVTRS